MSEFIKIEGGVTAPAGFKASGVKCGIKKSDRKDLAIVYSEAPALAAGVFTSNRMAAAPVEVSKNVLADGKSWQAVILNSGNANACTGQQGLVDAKETGSIAARLLGLEPESVLVASTGVIGEHLPMDKVEHGIQAAVETLSSGGASDAAEAIMTTDAYPKEIAIEFMLEGKAVRIGAMAKGAGMIAPELTAQAPLHATMLSVITTDVMFCSQGDALKSLQEAVDKSFNCISVDGDTSTNDTVFLLANGLAATDGLKAGADSDGARTFQAALDFVCLELAKSIVKDGEGATKLAVYRVSGAENDVEAQKMARTVADSLLFKTALFGRDPNWGRIMAAIGRSGATVEPSRVDVFIGDQQVVKEGAGAAPDEIKLKNILDEEEVEVSIRLNIGPGEAIFYGCDLTYDYVKLNAEYHT